MTMPHLMNCEHQAEGWCLKCVRQHANTMAQTQAEGWQSNADILDWLDTPCGRRLRMGYEYGYWYSSFPEDTGGVRQAITFRELIQQRMCPNPASTTNG